MGRRVPKRRRRCPAWCSAVPALQPIEVKEAEDELPVRGRGKATKNSKGMGKPSSSGNLSRVLTF